MNTQIEYIFLFRDSLHISEWETSHGHIFLFIHSRSLYLGVQAKPDLLHDLLAMHLSKSVGHKSFVRRWHVSPSLK